MPGVGDDPNRAVSPPWQAVDGSLRLAQLREVSVAARAAGALQPATGIPQAAVPSIGAAPHYGQSQRLADARVAAAPVADQKSPTREDLVW
jgi:hypothetical protein